MTAVERGRRTQPNVLWTVRLDVAVITSEKRVVVLPLSPQDSAPMELTGAGLEIWRLIDGDHTVEAIVDELCRRFQADQPGVQHDVEQFLAQLEAAQVIELLPRASERPADSVPESEGQIPPES